MMPNSLTEVIRRLEEQKAGIERALAALRDIEGTGEETGTSTAGTRGRRKGGMTPAGRRRLSEALKARWAAKRAGTASASAIGRKKRKAGGITPEGRKRLSEALKKRWAVKRAGSTVRKARKKAE
jgi:hypothetical protein